MTCERVKIGDSYAIVCSRGPKRREKCCVDGCKAKVTRYCDWKVPENKSGTCDAPICALHATDPDPRMADKDLCPEHAKAWEAWKLEHKRKAAP